MGIKMVRMWHRQPRMCLGALHHGDRWYACSNFLCFLPLFAPDVLKLSWHCAPVGPGVSSLSQLPLQTPEQEDSPMADPTRVARWRQRNREAGKQAITVWLDAEDKARLLDMAQLWKRSPSEIVTEAL